MFDRNLMKLPGMRAVMATLVVLALVRAAAIVGQALSLSLAISILWQGSPIDEAVPSAIAFGACFCVNQLVSFAQETMLDRYSTEQACTLRSLVLEAAIGERLIAHARGSAAVAATATDGIDEIQTYLRIIPPKAIDMVAISIPLLICEFFIDWPSGVILAVMFPVIMFFMVLLGRQARARSERQYESYTRLTNRFMDTLRGMRVLKAFGAADGEAASVYGHSENLRVATVKTLATATLSSAVLDLCATFGVAAVAMMLAFRLMDGSVGLQTGLAALILAPEYFAPIRAFASDYHASLDGKNALSALLGMLGQQTPASAARAPLAEEAARERASCPEAPSLAPWSAESKLELNDVAFEYGESGAGLHGVDAQVSGFQKIGIVGKSGAGKSTLANLLAGFAHPTNGAILVNGAPADLGAESWRRQVRYIPQSPYVFRATLADNIRFYRPDAPDADVADAARAVGLQPLVEELPHGLDTLVGEGARGLSGGEAHRVALARVLLDDTARVLVFDEPTAHLDIETELDLKHAMLAAMEGKLVFLATHRLHWIDDMDDVIVLGGEREAQRAGFAQQA